jgi:hypothetical protein
MITKILLALSCACIFMGASFEANSNNLYQSQDLELQYAERPETFVVFGDSLTSPDNSWAEQIDDMGLAQMKNHAQAGLRLIDLDIPDYLNCGRQKVIIWIGTNDAGNLIPTYQFKQELKDRLYFLKSRNCEVYIGLPIQLDVAAGWPKTGAYRTLVRGVSKNFNNVTVFDVPYDQSKTTDGLHPTIQHQAEIADFMINLLNL